MRYCTKCKKLYKGDETEKCFVCGKKTISDPSHYYPVNVVTANGFELERIRAKMTRTASLVIVGKNDGMKKNKTEELIYKYYDYIQKLEKTIDEQNDKLIKINDVIAKVENEKYNSI